MIWRVLGFGIAGLLVLGLLVFGIAAWAYRDIPAQTLEARYAAPNSKFIRIDGVRMHYRDEGQGPTVVLLHAHFASLVMWDAWADALSDDYRIVRIDMTGHGLTGPDPSGDYSMERTVELLGRVIDALELAPAYLGGTSMGGTVAIRYAAQHPDKIRRLILISPGALNARVRGRTTPPPLPRGIELLEIITPRMLFAGMLRGGFGDSEKVSDELIDRWHDMQLREGQREAEIERMRQYVSGDIAAVLAEIGVPALILWGESNPVVPVDQAYEIVELMKNSETTLITYPGVGHMAVHEAPQETAADARAYLDADG